MIVLYVDGADCFYMPYTIRRRKVVEGNLVRFYTVYINVGFVLYIITL